MRLIRKCQRETLVYWPLEGQSESGAPIFGAPQEMTCRWDDAIVQIVDADGTVKYSRAKIISQEYLAVGGMVRRGKIEDTPHWAGDLRDNEDVFEIMKVSRTPTLKYREYLNQAWV